MVGRESVVKATPFRTSQRNSGSAGVGAPARSGNHLGDLGVHPSDAEPVGSSLSLSLSHQQEEPVGLFGNDEEQDARLDEIERRMRRVVEQVSQLSVDLSVTRVELLKTRVAVDSAVKDDDLDPVFGEFNESIKATRAKLEEAQAAADESWAMLQDGSDRSLAALREGVDGAWQRLNDAESG